MTRYVVDASVAVEYLLRTRVGLAVAGIIESASLVAPELMDVEVLSVLRRAVLNGELEEARARMAVDDLAYWPVERISHSPLAPLAWQHYQNVSAYDAFYVCHCPCLRIAVAHCRRAASEGIRLGCRRPACPHWVIRSKIPQWSTSPAVGGRDEATGRNRRTAPI